MATPLNSGRPNKNTVFNEKTSLTPKLTEVPKLTPKSKSRSHRKNKPDPEVN